MGVAVISSTRLSGLPPRMISIRARYRFVLGLRKLWDSSTRMMSYWSWYRFNSARSRCRWTGDCSSSMSARLGSDSMVTVVAMIPHSANLSGFQLS